MQASYLHMEFTIKKYSYLLDEFLITNSCKELTNSRDVQCARKIIKPYSSKEDKNLIYFHPFKIVGDLPWNCPRLPAALKSFTKLTIFLTPESSNNSSYIFIPSTTLTYAQKPVKLKDGEKESTIFTAFLLQQVDEAIIKHQNVTAFPSNISVPTKVFAIAEVSSFCCTVCMEDKPFSECALVHPSQDKCQIRQSIY